MTYDTINRQKVLDVVDLLPCCDRKKFARYLADEERRLKYIEWYLPRLEKEKKIYSSWHEGKKVYSITEKRLRNTVKIPHDDICAEALLRMKESAQGIRFYSESFLRGLKLGAVPEWAVLLPKGTLLLFEYSTANNFARKKFMENKVDQLVINLHKFSERFHAKNTVGLLVIDAFRFQVKKFALEQGGDQFFYCDISSFMDVPDGKQRSAKIYFWGGDGESHALEDS